MRFLGISGSLRAASTNTALLRALKANAGDHSVELFERLSDIPIFNPDLQEAGPPDAIIELSRKLGSSDGLIIACPEYAHGIPGGLKNALDWLVAGSEAPGMPVMLVHASHRSAISRAQLREVLRTMSLRVFDGQELELPLLGKATDAIAAALSEASSKAAIRTALSSFADFIGKSPSDKSGAFTIR